MSANEMNLIWIDLEMTGLDPDQDAIIEIATIVTDSQLNIIAEGPMLAVSQTEEVLGRMDDWNKKTHGASGLLQRVRTSPHSAAEAERLTIEFLRAYVPERTSPMCGNSICQDRRFLYRGMPQLERFFHYRNLDVSTVKELVRRWAPDVFGSVKKAGAHLALDDIRESIAELAFYRTSAFKI